MPHPDYEILEDLWKYLSDDAREAISAGEGARVEKLAGYMEAVGRCMDCKLWNRCDREGGR